MSEPRAYTEEEVRAQFLAQMRADMEYWLELPNKTLKQRMSGFAFTVLATIDGCTIGLPGFRMSPWTHDDDAAYHIEKGENYYTDNIDIGGSLHEEWYQKTEAKP